MRSIDFSAYKNGLFQYLNSKKQEIENGIYYPQFEDIESDPHLKKMSKNTFIGLRREWYKDNFGKKPSEMKN